MNTISVITALVALAVGSGGGGIVGSFIMVKRYQVEKMTAQQRSQVDLQAVDVEQFKALFPGGLGEAVEHWRDEARTLYTEVEELREQRGRDHEEIVNLKADLRITNRKLEYTKNELNRAKSRIAHLEGEIHE